MSPTSRKKARWIGTGTSAMLAAAMIVSGCSSKEEGASSPSASAGASESASPSASPSASAPASQPADTGADTKDFVKLSWYMPKPIDNMKDQAAVEAEANKVIKEKLNAELHLNLIDNAGWEDKMKLISAAGEPYDIVFSTYASNRISDNVQKGAFLPLDELLQKYGQNILAKVDPRAWKAVTYKGKIMAIPAQTPYAPAGAHVFKKDMVEKYKFDYKSVKSIKDLEPFLAEIKKNEPSMIPLLATANGTAAGVTLYDYTTITPGISYSEKDGKIVKILGVPENKENYKTINDFYKKRLYCQGCGHQDGLSGRSQVGQVRGHARFGRLYGGRIEVDGDVRLPDGRDAGRLPDDLDQFDDLRRDGDQRHLQEPRAGDDAAQRDLGRQVPAEYAGLRRRGQKLYGQVRHGEGRQPDDRSDDRRGSDLGDLAQLARPAVGSMGFELELHRSASGDEEKQR
ncbi:type 2 periplasmic-binding domain-containing protein [Cohnella rhizosphaerae]|uniref:hypothetical protein n=1 Tax=Cohnella rhizosphaerae TaxID=1457232 RepID=UPI0030B880A2